MIPACFLLPFLLSSTVSFIAFCVGVFAQLGGFVSTAVMNPISVLVQGLQVDQVKSKGQ